MKSPLTLDPKTGRWRIGDDELHAGDVFELELPNGTWLPVRFEWEHKQDQRPTGYCIVQLADAIPAVLTPAMGASARLLRRPS